MLRYTEVEIIPTIESTTSQQRAASDGIIAQLEAGETVYLSKFIVIYPSTYEYIKSTPLETLEQNLVMLERFTEGPSTAAFDFPEMEESGKEYFLGTQEAYITIKKSLLAMEQGLTTVEAGLSSTYQINISTDGYIKGEDGNYEWHDGLKIEFDIEHRGANQKSMKGDLYIWNLSRFVLENIKANAHITIRSGYNSYYDTIFTGVIEEVKNEKKGADVKTSIKITGALLGGINAIAPPLSLVGAMSTVTDWNILYKETIQEWLGYVPAGAVLSNTKGIVEGSAVTPSGYILEPYIGLQGYGITPVFVGEFKTRPESASSVAERLAASGIGDWTVNFAQSGPTTITNNYVQDPASDCHADPSDIIANQFSGPGETYADGLNVMKEILGYNWLLHCDKLYIFEPGRVLGLEARLTYLNGLISFNETPETDITERTTVIEYTVKCILIPNIYPQVIVSIQPDIGITDPTLDEYFIVTEVVYKSSESEHICEFKCIKATDYNVLTGETDETGEFDFDDVYDIDVLGLIGLGD